VEKRFGTSTEWKSFAVHPEALDVVAHLSSRVFLGEEVSRNDEWHRITKDYTMFSVTAAHKIRKYPAWLRQYVHWFSKDCQQVREIRKQANAIILPTIEKRRQVRQEAIQNGEPVPKFDDAIDWFDQEGQGMDYDMPTLQLFLSHSALHTTTDLVVETILTLSHRQELIQELRDEMATVLRVDGWKKTALFNMKLLDSVLKEVQRIKPMGNGKPRTTPDACT
jgi:cytochrome P450